MISHKYQINVDIIIVNRKYEVLCRKVISYHIMHACSPAEA